MKKNRRADSVLFGLDFQINAAIVLMIENIKDLKSLRLEGESEDIEIELEDNQYILAQAKSVVRSSTDFNNVRKNLKKSLISLSDGNKKVDTQQLIFITNSPNPLNEDASKSIFYGYARRKFENLPESSQTIIKNYLDEINQPLELEKFTIQVLPFETDDIKERYKVIKQVVDDFMGELELDIPGLGNKVLDIWNGEVFKNGSKKDVSIKLTKKEIIWPIIVFSTNSKSSDEDFFKDMLDYSLYDEIISRYSSIIDYYCEYFEFFIKVLYDYNEYKTTKKLSEKPLNFVMDKWKDYLQEFDTDKLDKELQKGLMQIILYRIIRNRITIKKIKEEVNL